MTDVIANVHFLNALLVLAVGTITGIWGLILYFFVLKKPAPAPATATVGSNEQAEKPGELETAEKAEKPAVIEAPGAYKTWRIALIITAVDGLLQALLGLILLAMGQRPGTGTGIYYLHYVYGAIVALAIPVAVTYATSGKHVRRDLLIFSIAALILVAAGVRGLMTGFH
jgi:heme A synthase